MTDPEINSWDHLDTRALDAACREQTWDDETKSFLEHYMLVRDSHERHMDIMLSNAIGEPITCADLRRALDGPDCSAFAPGEPAPSWCVPTVVYLSLLGISVLAAVVAVIGGLG